MLGQTVLSKYQIVRRLDRGGMCDVYLARQTDLGREAAAKVLQEPLLKERQAVEHFRREIFIMSRFQHPHAVTYYDSGQAGKAGPVLVMEYLRGIDLNSLLQRDGRFATERVGRLLVQLCDVLQAAHTAGVIHRDLKLGNLMVLQPGTPREVLKLMDFGLAKMTSLLYISPDELTSYVPPSTSGTPEYIAPEQIRGNEGDPRTDLYSVGVLLFELLTGRLPFVHTNLDRLLDAHLDDDPPAFAEVLREHLAVPRGIEEVVRQCLAKDPQARPQSASELADLFLRALGRPLAVASRPGSREVARILSTARPPAPSAANASPDKSGRLLGAVERAIDRHAVRHSIEASMPESMAMVKLKGFIHDLGGEIVESVPGMIRVRVGEPKANKDKPRGLLGWFGASQPTAVAQPLTDLEMHMERRDPRQPNLLTITLVMRCPVNLITPEWRSRCEQISRDLKAYLIGR